MEQHKAYTVACDAGWVGALSAANTVIGAQSTGATSPWDGKIAHCAIWNRALAPAEIAALATI